MPMTRAEHVDWTRQRALAELDGTERGRSNALASVASDLGKHAATADHPAVMLGMMLAMNGHLATDQQMRDHVNGIQ
jgi:hypothetical protein